jgi:phytanoyl-CoA hydroxylase
MNVACNPRSDAASGVDLKQFARDGCLLLEGFFASHQIDDAASAVRRLLEGKPGGVMGDNPRGARRSLWAQANDPETGRFALNDLYLASEEVRGLALDGALVKALGALLGETVALASSANFARGSSQPRHIDTLYMTPRTPHSLIAAWIAFEDIHPASGPLVYFPGSHRIPLYTFNDATHHASRGEIADWFDYIDVQLRLRGLRERTLLARKGDVFISHADLVHGGSSIADRKRTRGSLVCHYFGESDCFARAADLVPMNGAHWMRRQPHAVTLEPSPCEASGSFPEENDLASPADVREAAEGRPRPSGKFPFGDFGRAEGRGAVPTLARPQGRPGNTRGPWRAAAARSGDSHR